MIFWPAKDPGETLDYVFDWTDRLTAGESLTGSVVTATGVTVTSSRTGAIVTAFLSGGSAGSVAKVVNTITTNMGRTDVETAIVPIGGGPIDMETAKAHLKVNAEQTDDDGLIAVYLAAAVAAIEDATGRCLTAQIVTYSGTCFGRTSSGALRLFKGPIQSVLTFNYEDASGNMAVISDYQVLSYDRAEIIPASTWPSIGALGLVITYVAGYDPASVPRPLIQAVLLMLGHFYANREAVTIGSGNTPATLPLAVDSLIAPYRAVGIA